MVGCVVWLLVSKYKGPLPLGAEIEMFMCYVWISCLNRNV